MTRTRGWAVWAAVAALAAGVGCGDTGEDAAAPAPTAAQVSQVQKAAPASSSMAVTSEAANDAIVDSGSGGAATSTKSGVPQKSYAPSGINYQASLDLLVDLDAVDGNGNDLHPHASGVIHVVASGSVVGTQLAGEASYAVTVTYDTAVGCSDPGSGATATVAAGAAFNYALKVTWSWTDDLNWTISASCDASLANYVLTVIQGAEMAVVSVDWEKHGQFTLTRSAGALSIHGSGSETGRVEVTDNTGTHVVVIAEASGWYTITVDGSGFGPYLEAQAEATFGITIE